MTNDPPVPARRSALTTMIRGGVALLAAPVLYVIGRYMTPPPPASSAVVVGRETEIGANEVRIVKVGTTDAAVMRDEHGGIVALDMRCTHAGCAVRWRQQDGIFDCPCHGGQFERDGTVLKGPPKRPLEHLTIRSESGTVIVTDIRAGG